MTLSREDRGRLLGEMIDDYAMGNAVVTDKGITEWNRIEPQPTESELQVKFDSVEFQTHVAIMDTPKNKTNKARRRHKERRRLQSLASQVEMARLLAVAKIADLSITKQQLIQKIVNELN